MKKIIVVITIIFLLTSLSTIPITSLNNIETIKSGSIFEKKKWTFMMYEDYDFYDESYIERLDFAKLSGVKSGKNLNIIILKDSFYNPGAYFSVNRFGGKRLLENLDEINMGDYKTLKNFIIYCKENFPAEHYILDIFDHGGGWMGACEDDTDNDWLTMSEIKRALIESGGVDIISFIVPCLMGVVEGVYQLRDCAEVYIGKQPNAGSALHVAGPLCDLLNNEYYLSNIDIGRRIIDFYKEKVDVYPWSKYTGKALSAMTTDNVTDLVKVINNLSIILKNNLNEYIDDIRNINAKTESFPTRRIEASERYKARFAPEIRHIDINDFAKNFLEIKGINETLRNCLIDVMEGVNKTVIAEHHTKDHPEAHGLSIYFPDVLLRNNPIDNYLDSGLEFTINTSWDEFLLAYHDFYATVDDNEGADYKSIQDAINNSSDGDVVYVKNGVYYENVIISKLITLVGESKDTTIIDGGQHGDVVSITADKAMLFYLGFRNSSCNGAAGVYIRSNYTIIRLCDISRNYHGIYIFDSSNNKILRSNIRNNYFGVCLKYSNENNFGHNYLEDNKIDVRFSDSFDNIWKNVYLEHPNRHINIILGFRTIGKISIPCINLNWLR